MDEVGGAGVRGDNGSRVASPVLGWFTTFSNTRQIQLRPAKDSTCPVTMLQGTTSTLTCCV